MKRILVGFEQPKLIREITKYVQETSSEGIEFVVRCTKASILSEIADGKYDIVLLMEECGKDMWTMDEFIQIKDSYNISLIPIVSEAYRGSKELVAFCNYGITGAVFIRKKGVYKADEIFRMIYNPRTLKEARVYYGISTLSDSRSGGSVLDEVVFEQVRSAILDASTGKPLGERYIEAISDLTPVQVGDLIKRMDENTLNMLKQTVEFYDVLNILKQNKVIRNYRVPKEIKQQQKRKGHRRTPESEDVKEQKVEEDLQFENTIVLDIPAEDVGGVAVAEGEISYEEEYGDAMMLDELIEGDENISFSTAEEEIVEEDDEEEEFSFATEMKIDKKVISEQGKKKMFGELEEGAYEDVKEKKGVKKLGELEESSDEIGGEEVEGKKTSNIVAVGIIVAVFILLLILAYLFIRITVQRDMAQNGMSGAGGYDTLYTTDEKNYELTNDGNVVLNEESGVQGGDDMGSSVEVAAPEEEMDFSVFTEEELSDSNVIEQSYNDTSAFEDGMEYKGLDLVNMLNGTQGANCVLCLKNGATVSVTRGDASLEDFKPSGVYRCVKTDTEMQFVEK